MAEQRIGGIFADLVLKGWGDFQAKMNRLQSAAFVSSAALDKVKKAATALAPEFRKAFVGGAAAAAGQQALFAALADETEKAAKKLSKQLLPALDKVKGVADSVAGNLKTAFLAGLGAATGFIALGSPGHMELLNLKVRLLSRSLASLFVPFVSQIVGVIDSIRAWADSLTYADKVAIYTWIKQAAMVALVGFAIAKTVAIGIGMVQFAVKLWGAVSALVTVVKAFGAAMSFAFANPILLGILAVVAAVGYLVYKLRSAADEMNRLAETSKRLQPEVNAQQKALENETKGMNAEAKEKYLREVEQAARKEQQEAIKKGDQKAGDEAEKRRRAALQAREDLYRAQNGLSKLDRRTTEEKGDINFDTIQAGRQFSGVSDLFKQLNTAFADEGKDAAKQTATNTEKMEKHLAVIAGNVGKPGGGNVMVLG